MVGIVAVSRFCEAGSAAFSSYINYIDRKEAVREAGISQFNLFSRYMDYMDNDTKTIADQQLELERVSALFTKDMDSLTGDAKTALKACFRDGQKNGSNLWQIVISFDNEYLEKVGLYDSSSKILNEAQLRKAARKAITAMLSREHLEHAVWTAAFHYNTDNIHIHVAITEPQPMREKRLYTRYRANSDGEVLLDKDGHRIPERDSQGNIVRYEGYKGVFRQSSIEELKSVLRSELEENADIYRDITRLIRETLIGEMNKSILLQMPEFEDGMLSLYEALVSTEIPRRYWQYNQHRLTDLRGKIDELSKMYIASAHQEDYELLLQKLQIQARQQADSYGGKTNDYVQNMLYGTQGLYARLGNVILKQLAEHDRQMHQYEKTASTTAYDKNRVTKRTERLRSRFLTDTDSLNRWSLRRGFRLLEHNLKQTYLQYRNMQEAERLQAEIEARGEDELDR